MLTLTALYLVAGLIEKGMGQGPLMAGVLLVLLLSIAGIPPFLGFWPKLLLLRGLFDGSGFVHADASPDWRVVLLIGAVLLNALLTLIAGIRFWIRLHWQSVPAGPAPRSLSGTGAVLVLTALCLFAGLWPNRLIESAGLAANGLIHPVPYVETVGLAP
jgi:multicomponent Na+:H+ antiporter subunit D